ncbi:hypothetical protein X946_5158 [Burkholderia sp. ABCPW 111]|nr:hypothetical protein X946_5158 [Burkholderia sp. ABCPW 111]
MRVGGADAFAERRWGGRAANRRIGGSVDRPVRGSRLMRGARGRALPTDAGGARDAWTVAARRFRRFDGFDAGSPDFVAWCRYASLRIGRVCRLREAACEWVASWRANRCVKRCVSRYVKRLAH